MPKKPKKKGMKKSRKLELAASILEAMLDGDTDDVIIEELDITPQDFAIAKKFLLSNLGHQEAAMSSEERYARYLIAQAVNDKDLTALIANLNHSRQHNALVGAIRLRADILHKKIEVGQTLGVIDRQAERKEILVGGVLLADLPDKDLKKGVISAFAGLKALMEKHGDGTSLLELEPGQLHHGESVPALVQQTAVTGAPEMKAPAKGKRNKAKTGKRHAGRRRVKG